MEKNTTRQVSSERSFKRVYFSIKKPLKLICTAVDNSHKYLTIKYQVYYLIGY